MARPVAMMALALVVGLTGCGGAGAAEDDDVTIVVTSRGYPEEELLREIYAHALETVGFRVRRHDDPHLLVSEELERGLVSGYPDHMETALTELTPLGLADVPGSARAAYREARRRLESKGLVPFPPTSFARSSAVAVSRRTAAEHDLRSLSDLREPSHGMRVIEGEYFCYCHGPPCLASLERVYGFGFGGFDTVEPPARLYRALRSGAADAGVVLSTEGQLARHHRRLVLLEDKQQRLPASNALWVTSRRAIDQAGPEYERTIMAAQKSLSLRTMRRLNAEVELEGRKPGEVAAEYLKSIGFEARPE